MSHTLFVYGTLQRGFGNHCLLDNARYISDAKTKGTFTMLSLGGFPGVIPGGDTVIKGELYEVSDEDLAEIDYLEDHPNWYERKDVAVTDAEGLAKSAEMYVLPENYNADGLFAIVSSGSWRSRTL